MAREFEFDLPFQWCSGSFISPFIPSSDESIADLCTILHTHCSPLPQNVTICDLGCGDGRVLLAVAERIGCRALGLELDDTLVKTSQAKLAGTATNDYAYGCNLSARVRFECCDLLQCPLETFDDVNIIFTYLLPDALELLGPRLLQLIVRKASPSSCVSETPTSHLKSKTACVPLLAIISKTWPIPALSNFLHGTETGMFIYRFH